jgi:tRNA threonylcarbamoyladenosine biosynthesis protein TsaB
MGYILSIDTATETAQVCLSENGRLIGSSSNEQQKDHAAFLQPAIKNLLDAASLNFTHLSAIAVTDGPGSYTGLRVGMASAKGLCYAMQLPLITVGTLHLMAASAQNQANHTEKELLFCPMIDARRMEVFTALYNQQMEVLQAPSAIILTEDLFATELQNGPVFFTGSGAVKWQTLCKHQNAFFENINNSAAVFSQLSFQLYENQSFADMAYAEPRYAKAFFTTQKRQEQ